MFGAKVFQSLTLSTEVSRGNNVGSKTTVVTEEHPKIDQQVNIFLQYLLWISGFPVTVVEAGTFKGDFAIGAADVMKQLERGGKVFTADPMDYGVEARFKKEGFEDYIEYWKGDFGEMLVKRKLWDIDLAFIDSGPIEDIMEDRELFMKERGIRFKHYQAVLPRMASGGLVVVDDMTNIGWSDSEKILEDADLFLKGGRGLTIKQVK